MIADTGFVVAFASREDAYHDWALGIAGQITQPLLTCEAVLAESAFHLRSAAVVLGLINDGLLRPALDVGAEARRLEQIARRFADRRPDLADVCLIRLSELHPRRPVVTVDVGDFRVYRRGRNEAIPLVTPPELSR